MNRKFMILIAVLGALTGCSLTTPRDVGNGHRVFLAPLTEKMACRDRMGSLIVDYPRIPEMLDSSRIALLDQTGRWDYFAGMRWADFLPSDMQSTLIKSLSASGEVSSVSSDDTIGINRLRLGSEVNNFEAVYHADGMAPDVEIDIAFALREGDSSRTIKHFTASGRIHAAVDNADAIGLAFEQAFTEVQRKALKSLLSCNF